MGPTRVSSPKKNAARTSQVAHINAFPIGPRVTRLERETEIEVAARQCGRKRGQTSLDGHVAEPIVVSQDVSRE